MDSFEVLCLRHTIVQSAGINVHPIFQNSSPFIWIFFYDRFIKFLLFSSKCITLFSFWTFWAFLLCKCWWSLMYLGFWDKNCFYSLVSVNGLRSLKSLFTWYVILFYKKNVKKTHTRKMWFFFLLYHPSEVIATYHILSQLVQKCFQKSFPCCLFTQKDPSNEHIIVYRETNTGGNFQSIIINVSKSCFILPFTILGGGKHKAGLMIKCMLARKRTA